MFQGFSFFAGDAGLNKFNSDIIMAPLTVIKPKLIEITPAQFK